MDRVKISYFTDALCVWAYVSQVRMDELKANFKDAVELDCRYFHVFGNVANKMEATWRERGGLPAYRRHVREIVEKFGHVSLHELTWETDVPNPPCRHIFSCVRHGMWSHTPGARPVPATARPGGCVTPSSATDAISRKARCFSKSRSRLEYPLPRSRMLSPAVTHMRLWRKIWSLPAPNPSLLARRCCSTRDGNVLQAMSAIGSSRPIFANC